MEKLDEILLLTMKKLLLILLCVPLIGFSQGWENTYGGLGNDFGYSVQQTNDGGYIITGGIAIPGDSVSNLYLIKTDGNGNTLWTKTFGSGIGISIQQTTDGGYIITGSNGFSYPYGSYGDVCLIKTDMNGDSIWTKTFNFGEGFSVQQTNDGGYIITGGKDDLYGYSEDIFLIKTDGNGNTLWTKTFGDSNYERGNSVQQTTDGGYIITGYHLPDISSSTHPYLVKTDINGDSLWTKTFDDGGMGFSIQQTNDGGYIIAGMIHNPGDTVTRVCLIKTDGNGNTLWTKTPVNGIGVSFQQTNDGGYIITGGIAVPGDTVARVCLIKTDSNGDSLWTRTFGGLGNELGYSVEQTTDGGYIICGYTNSFGNGYDIYLIKTDGNGSVTSEFTIPLNSNRELKKVVDILGRDVNLEKNKPFIEIYDDGTVEKKIIIE